jgi:hypothetical protein
MLKFLFIVVRRGSFVIAKKPVKKHFRKRRISNEPGKENFVNL